MLACWLLVGNEGVDEIVEATGLLGISDSFSPF